MTRSARAHVADGVGEAGDDLSPMLSIGLPLALAAVVLGGRAAGEEFYDLVIYGEDGFVELATAAFAIAAGIVALRLWRRRAALPSAWLGCWLLVFAAGSFFFAGEELSWGQHLAGWSAPEAWQSVNERGETNLHNATNWLDEKPKAVVELATIVGGILLPLFIRWRRIRLEPARDWRAWFVPTTAVTATCVVALALKSVERARDLFGWYPGSPLDIRMSEPQEMYFGLFFLLYVLSWQRRLAALR